MPYPDFLVGEPLHKDSDLRVRDAEDPRAPDGTRARAISRGATGLVLRVIQADTIERAVKILAPEDRLFASGNWDYFVEVFEREKRKLAALTHSHLAKLISFGTIPLEPTAYKVGDPPSIPYIVMEFVEGQPLHLYTSALVDSKEPANLSDIVLALFDDICSALLYLHHQEAVHCDIKEANILVRRSSRPEAVLVDLGAAHVFTENHSDTTRYITTPSRVSRLWQERANKDLPASMLREGRVHLDLYMFGSMLRLFLDQDLPDSRVRYDWQPRVLSSLTKAFDQLGLVILNRVADMCLKGAYNSAAEVQQDLAAIGSKLVAPLGIPELSLGTNTQTSLALPEDSVPFTKRFISIINHPCVQRLRRISQLDFVSLIYLGATHTRLLHSVETYNLTRRYIGKLLGDPIFRAYSAEKAKLEATLLAGLLHDIGHYPLEHIFEDFALRGETSGPFSGILRDEEVTSALLSPTGNDYFVADTITHYLQRCSQILRTDRIASLPDLIETLFGTKVLQYLRRILGRSPDPDEGIGILRGIVNGPLDVDKVSYLRTDSRFSGVGYGRAIDVDSLLASLTCTVNNSPTLAITEKAVCAVESIATGRRWMFQRVYWHKTNRAMMAMLRFAPQQLMERGALNFAEFFEATYHLSDIEAVKWLDKRFTDATRSDNLENPAQLILDGRRGIYKLLLEFSATDTDDRSLRARSYLMGRTCAEWSKIACEIAKLARRHTSGVRDSDILIDIPSARRPQIGEVVVIGSLNVPRRLSEISDEFRSSQQFFERAAMNCRIFMHPAVRKSMAESETFLSFQKEVREFLWGSAPR